MHAQWYILRAELCPMFFPDEKVTGHPTTLLGIVHGGLLDANDCTFHCAEIPMLHQHLFELGT